MSVSKWRYTEECNGRPCPGDCDHCSFEPTDLISRADAIEAVNMLDIFPPTKDVVARELMALPSAEQHNKDAISREGLLRSWEELSTRGRTEFDQVIMTIPALPSADAEPKMTEEVREALMRLTMCAREECGMCKYKDECGFDFQYKISTDNMNTLLDALSAEAVPQVKQTDTLIIADALRYLAKDTERHLADRTRADALRQQFLKYGASMCKGGDEE